MNYNLTKHLQKHTCNSTHLLQFQPSPVVSVSSNNAKTLMDQTPTLTVMDAHGTTLQIAPTNAESITLGRSIPTKCAVAAVVAKHKHHHQQQPLMAATLALAPTVALAAPQAVMTM